MNSFATSRLCDEPASFVAQIQALADAAPDRPKLADAHALQVFEALGKTRRLSVDQLCARYSNENPHTEHVARLALQLFDATHRSLGVSRDDRPLLEAASRLHDVAYRTDPVHHLERSAEIAWREGGKGFSADQRACIAAVMLLHAGNWKSQLGHPLVRRVRDPQQALRLGAFLRVADGLDWGHVQDAAIVGVVKLRKLVRVRVNSPWLPANLTRADQKADLWRETFPVDIQFVPAKSRRVRPLVEPGSHPLVIAHRLLSVQYKAILADVDGAIAGADPEYLHRIRVGIRRLRSVLRAFRKCLPDTDPIDETLASLGDMLGAARDLDVWLAFLQSEEVAGNLSRNRHWRAFVQHHEELRRLQRPTVDRELRGAQFRTLRRQMAKLLRAQLPPLLQAERPLTLEALAAKRFVKELRQVREFGALRHEQSSEKLHRLRVALRRARYLGECFRPVLGKNAGWLTRRLHQVEKPLAQIHDLDVGLALMQHSGPAAPRAFTVLLQARREHQHHMIELAWYRLVELEKRTRRELQAKTKPAKTRRRG